MLSSSIYTAPPTQNVNVELSKRGGAGRFKSYTSDQRRNFLRAIQTTPVAGRVVFRVSAEVEQSWQINSMIADLEDQGVGVNYTYDESAGIGEVIVTYRSRS